jgi:hypothetical protein
MAVLYKEKEKHDNAPALAAGTWQETASRRWLTSIYAY